MGLKKIFSAYCQFSRSIVFPCFSLISWIELKRIYAEERISNFPSQKSMIFQSIVGS